MNADRLASLYREYGPVIYWRCLRLLGDRAAAEDATQETFLRVLKHLDRAPDPGEAVRWICRIATNYCLNLVRDRARDPEPRDTLPDQAAPVSLDAPGPERIFALFSDRALEEGEIVAALGELGASGADAIRRTRRLALPFAQSSVLIEKDPIERSPAPRE